MKRILFNMLIIANSVMLCASFGFSQEELVPTTDTLDTLFENPKLTHGEMLLRDFIDGRPTARVIVNLSKPASFASTVEREGRKSIFGDVRRRRELRETIREIQTRVISRVDPDKVWVKERFEYVSGFSAEVTLEGLQELAQSDEVVSIEKDQVLQAHLAQGIPLINASTVRNTYSGAGMAIAICDTGIDYSHPMLGGGGFPNNKVIGGYDCGDDDNDPMDRDGHGTCCAGIAAGDIGVTGDYVGGVAHSAKLYALKISFGNTGSAQTSDMIEAWEWCITHQQDDPLNPIMIISTSFGGGKYTTVCDNTSPSMTEAAANAVAAGMTLFVSSGNDGYCFSIGWPACISHVVSVGAVYDSGFGTYSPCVSSDSCVTKYSTNQCETGYFAIDSTAADSVPSYSNTATFMDLLAPSNRAYTTDITGFKGYSYEDYYTSFGGTSAACPYAAGAAACLQSGAQSVTGSFLTPAEVRSNLTGTGDLITDQKVGITKPRVNLGSAVEDLGVPPINITELVPAHGGYGTTIKVKGSGFGEQRSAMIDAQDGYYSFVTFSEQSETIIATKYLLWSDTMVKVIFEKLFIDQDGDYLQDGEEPLLAIGDVALEDYAVTVNTIWFHDLNSNDTYDDGDEIYSSAFSNSQAFTLTDEPVISKRLPAEIPRLDVLKIWGYNFGAEQGDGVVRIGLGLEAASDTLGLGDPLDGYLKWTDTVIKVKMRVPWTYNDKIRWIWVETSGKKSNAKPVKILPIVP